MWLSPLLQVRKWELTGAKQLTKVVQLGETELGFLFYSHVLSRLTRCLGSYTFVPDLPTTPGVSFSAQRQSGAQ